MQRRPRGFARVNSPIAQVGVDGPTIAIGTIADDRQPATKIKLDQAEQASNVGGMEQG
jgi:hypothetical protein